MTINYSRYSHHARRALIHANLLATHYRHGHIDNGHLLVGLMLAEHSIGCQALSELQVSAEQAKAHLATLYPVLPQEVTDPPNTPALDATLLLAADEAVCLGRHYIGTEHLVLGIARTNEGQAGALLQQMGILPQQIQSSLRRSLQRGIAEFTLQDTKRVVRLSEISRRVVNATEQIALLLDHHIVGTGHLLLLLVQERRSSTATLLRESGLDEARLWRRLKRSDAMLLGSVEEILLLALAQAEKYGSHYTGTEHLMMALLESPSGQSLLQSFDVDTRMLRRGLTLLLGH